MSVVGRAIFGALIAGCYRKPSCLPLAASMQHQLDQRGLLGLDMFTYTLAHVPAPRCIQANGSTSGVLKRLKCYWRLVIHLARSSALSLSLSHSLYPAHLMHSNPFVNHLRRATISIPVYLYCLIKLIFNYTIYIYLSVLLYLDKFTW